MLNNHEHRVMELHAEGFCCSQIMFLLALDMQNRENPDLVRAVSGLCHGIGFSRDVCGVLSGGACLLSLFTGKGTHKETGHILHADLQTDFVLWFRQHIDSPDNGIRCAEILSAHDRRYCAKLVDDAFIKIMDLLMENSIDPLPPGT